MNWNTHLKQLHNWDPDFVMLQQANWLSKAGTKEQLDIILLSSTALSSLIPGSCRQAIVSYRLRRCASFSGERANLLYTHNWVGLFSPPAFLKTDYNLDFFFTLMKLVRIGNTTCDNKDKTQKQFKKVKQTDSSTWLRCPSKLNNPVTVTQANFQSRGKALYHTCARARTHTLGIQYKWIY